MSTDNIGTEFLENAGFLEMAETNNIILLFPQVFNNFKCKGMKKMVDILQYSYR